MSKKSNPIAKCILTTLTLAGGFLAANIGAVAATCARNSKKMEQHKDENNMMFAYLFQREVLEVGPDTQNAYVTVLNSYVDISIPKPEKEVMNVEITSFCSRLNIDLPFDVKINCQGSNELAFSNEGEAESPVINLIIRDFATNLNLSFDGGCGSEEE